MGQASFAVGKRSPVRSPAFAWLLDACRVSFCLVAGLTLFSCGTTPPAPSESALSSVCDAPSKYVVFIIIHGDGGYLFHDTDGNKYRADEEALAGAMRVAEHNSQAEVFIFHEKRRRHVLFLFPRHDGEFYYYRNGRLVAQEAFWRDKGISRFDPEIELYERFRSDGRPGQVKFFLYFGHEIPEVGGTDYDASYRKRSFTVHDLVKGLKRLRSDSTRFDLVALSTCFNGTPYTVSALSPYARYIIASPGNLHLSYLDLRPFEALYTSLIEGDVYALAKECARQSFNRLTQDLQTEISVSVYDVDRAQDYLHSVDSAYTHALARFSERAPMSTEHCDCAEDPTYVRESMDLGVDVFFRAARFGRSARKLTHSGWECLRIPD